MKSLLLNKKNFQRIFSLIFILLFLKNDGSSQVSYLGLDGGLEGIATIDNTTTYAAPQAGKWAKANATQTISNETTTVRSGSNSLKVNNTSTTGRRVWSPNFSFGSTTSNVTVQYYRRVANLSNTQESQAGIINNTEGLAGTYNVPSAINTWEKVSYTKTSSTYTTISGLFMHRQLGTGGDMFIDDMCVYTGAVDVTAANAPNCANATVNNATASTLDVSWTAASGGVDGGGYLVVRGTSDPTTSPNVNGIYAVSNTLAAGMTVVFNGTGTSFTDVGLAASTTYYYRVYTYDKAYNYSSAVTGNGTTTGGGNSTSSDIIRNAGFSEPTNIAYSSYQEADLTSSSTEVAKFDIQDGGGAADGDALTTSLTAITFSVTNVSNLRRLALYDGTTEIAEIAASSPAVFSGLTGLSAPDDGSKSFSVRASFLSAVTDNQQFSFTISSATADGAGSAFAAGDAGAAASSITGDANRIEVTATKLLFVQQPSNTNISVAMSPSVTVEAVDANNNRDLDFTSAIRITSTGTLSGTPVDAAASSGLATFASLTHTAPGTGLTLNAERQSSLDWDITSNTFNIVTACASDLIFSEYLEGSSNNKYIEIYNGTGSAVDLSDYKLQLFTNGSGTASPDNTLSGSLADNTTIVYKNSAATIFGGAATSNTSVAFNGDDAVALYKISTGTYVDIIGRIGEDPGTEWTSASNTTLDKTLVRKSTITSGITVNPGSGFPTLEAEWTQYNIDDVTHLGSHTMTCCTPPATQASSVGTSSPATDGFDVSWTAGNGNGTMIVVRPTASANTLPSSGTSYAANVAWASAGQIDANNRVVFRAAGTSVSSLSGLTAQTQYTIAAYEYSTTGDCYNLTSPPSGNRYTLSLEPSAHPATFTATPISSVQIDVGFSAASTITNADGYIILRRQDGSYPDATNIIDGTVPGSLSVPAGTTLVTTITNSATTSYSNSGLTASTQYYYAIIAYNADATPNGQTYNYRTVATIKTATATTPAPAPEINVKQGVTGYSSGSTYNFGTVAWGNFSDIVFSIENTGDANLTITTPLSASGDYSITAQPSSPVAGSGSTTFTIRFTPTATGTRNGSVTISSNDADEGSYVVNFTGTGSPSVLSDIISDVSFTYNSNIDYTLYQGNPITNTTISIGVYRFTIRDGGASSPDADNLPTILASITFSSVAGISNIRSAALFDGNTMINNSPAINVGASTIAFSGLSYSASDNSTRDMTLRVSFLTSVTDNQQLSFTVTNANVTAAGSSTSSLFTSFANALSSTTSDRNRIEVTATTIAWGTQPANGTKDNPLAAFSVNAVDANGNTDLDQGSCTVALTTTGSGFTSSSPYTFSSGVITVNDVQYNAIQTGINITATAQSCLGSTEISSNNFDISGITYVSGDYRTIGSGTWISNTADGLWEKYNGTSWASNNSPTYNTTANIYISNGNTMTTGGSYGNTVNIIVDGGTFNNNHPSTAVTLKIIEGDFKANAALTIPATGSVLVEDGGAFWANHDGVVITSGATLTVKSGGYLKLNHNLIRNDNGIFGGTEDFQAGSYFELLNWFWGTSATYRSIVNFDSDIDYNSSGYKFGYYVFNPTVAQTSDFTFVGSGVGIINLCYDDMIVYNSSAFWVGGASNKTGTNGYLINGNLIVNSGNFNFGTSFSGDPFSHQFTVNGNFEYNGSGTLKIHRASTNPTSLSGYVNFKGNVTIASTATFSNDKATDNSRMDVNFNGSGTFSTPQFLNIGCTATGINMNVKNNTFVKLKTSNLTFDGIATLTTAFIVEAGSTMHFGWADDGTTPLFFTMPGSPSGTNQFTSQQGATLFITSGDGLNDGTTANVSNIRQVSVSNRSINQTATFWYVGKQNQVTGNALTTGSTAKVIIVDMLDNSKVLTLTNQLAVSNGTTISATGGKLDIRKGIVQETTSAYFTSCTGTLYMTDGEYRVAYNSINSSDLIPRMDGVSYSYSLTGGTVNLQGDGTGTGEQFLRGARDYYSLTFSGGGNKWISTALTNIGDNSTIGLGLVTVRDDNTKLDVTNSTFSGNAGLTMTNSSLFRMSSLNQTLPGLLGTYTMTGGTIELYGTSATQTHSLRGTDGSSGTITYYNVELNSAGSNVAFDAANVVASASFNVNGTMNVNNPACFKIGANFSIGGTGTFETKAGSTLKYGSGGGITTAPTAAGNIRTTTRTFSSSASYGFVGSVDMVGGNALPSSVVNLYTEKAAGANTVTLSNPVTVTGDNQLTTGKMLTTSTNLLIVADNASSSSGSASSFVDGPMKKTGNDAFVFPTGDGTKWARIGITAPSQATTEYTAEYFASGFGNYTLAAGPPVINNVSTIEYWNLNQAINNDDVQVTLFWEDAASSGINDCDASPDDLRIAHWNSSSEWEVNVDAVVITGGCPGAGTVQTNGMQPEYSPFAFSSKTAGINPLPIELLFFYGEYDVEKKQSVLFWKTLSEVNNEYFTVERSLNTTGKWYEAGKINGSGNSSLPVDYHFYDPKPETPGNESGTQLFYRLRQTDYDGNYSYSGTVSVNILQDKNGISVFPNPAQEKLEVFNIGLESEISVYDSQGKKIFSKKYFPTNDMLPLVIGLSDFSPGIYLIISEAGINSSKSKFVKE